MTSTKAQFMASREDVALVRAMADINRPSTMAREIVSKRQAISTMEQLRIVAKDMRVSVRELASELLISRELVNTRNSVSDIAPANSPVEIDGRSIESEPETFPSQFEAGYIEIESAERRAIAKARLLAEKATRPDYYFGRELLTRIGRDYGAVISSLPTGEVKLYSVKREVNSAHAAKLQAAALEQFENGRARIEAIEKAIAAVPLSKGGKLRSRIPAAMKREEAKALDAMKAIRARLDKANERVENAKAITADGMRLELVNEFDAYAGIPLHAAIETFALPANIMRRPFPEYLRPRIRRSPISPVECEVLRNERDAEQAIIRKALDDELAVILATAKEADKQLAENARSAKNAEYKERRAIAARIRRANKK